MGEESEKRPILVYNGERFICEVSAALPEIKLVPETIGGTDGTSPLDTFSMKGTIYLKIKDTKCKTRKRFVKLLMANGWSRNAANYLAGRLKKGASYKEAYQFLKLRTLI
ncbi:MAG: hypothetical protein IJ206_09320 [Oscillospiraceae bacterium]|nr:hypothetical protein [Oscillospiraceae bacterium]